MCVTGVFTLYIQYQHLLKHITLYYVYILGKVIQSWSLLVIITNYSKITIKSDEVWWKANNHGKLLAHGTNTNFGAKNNMQSHRSKLYTLLSVILFIYAYRNAYLFPYNLRHQRMCLKKRIIYFTTINNMIICTHLLVLEVFD